MSRHLGDITEDSIIYFPWSSNGADGASITRATNGTISVYKNDDTTQSTAGITDTEDFDSLTGIHMVKIDTSADAFYAIGKDYSVVLSAATIDGKTVNAVLATFSIENRFAEVDVVKLNGGDQSLLDLKDFADDGYDPSTNKVQGVVLTDTATNLTNAAGAGDFTATMKTSIGTAVAASAVASVTGNVGGNVTGSVGSVVGAVGSVTGNVGGNVTGSVGSVVGAVGSVTGNVGGNVTGSVGSLATQAKADVNAEVLDVLNVDTFAEPGQEAPGATISLVKKLGYLYKAWRNKTTQTATTQSLYADDGTTVDQKATVSDDGTTFTKGEIGTGP